MSSRQIVKVLGRRGGRMRALRLPPGDRRRIASLGGKARAKSLQTARRIDANLRYAALLPDLQGASTEVERLGSFEGPLPGIYPEKR